MAGLFDILKMLSGDGGQPLGGPPSALPTGDNISSMLAGGSPDAAQGAPQPAPQAPPQMAAPQAPAAPVTPPSTDGGLGGFLSRMVTKATSRDPESGMSFMDKLGQVGAGMTDQMGDSRGAQAALQAQADKRVAATQDDAKRQKMTALADQLGMSPREKLIFLADPDGWVKANAPRLGIHDTAEGAHTQYGEPGSADSVGFTAPKFGVQNGEGFSATPNSVKDLGGLNPSPEQQLQNAVKEATQKATAAYHEHMVKATQQRADADTYRAHKPSALGNGGDWRARVVGQGSVQ